MKIKSIIVALGLIITMISGVKSNYFNQTTSEAENSNTVIAVEENLVEEENIISENEQIEIEQEQVANNTENVEIPQEPVEQEVQKETPQITTSQDNKNTKKTETAKQPTAQETTPKQEQVNTSVVETPKKEEPVPQPVTKTLTPDDLEYWCVAGGTHHIAGDGANEHGYYSSWNEANQAFENYTKGWNSVQYKIDTCSCGKYYFWAIQ